MSLGESLVYTSTLNICDVPCGNFRGSCISQKGSGNGFKFYKISIQVAYIISLSHYFTLENLF